MIEQFITINLKINTFDLFHFLLQCLNTQFFVDKQPFFLFKQPVILPMTTSQQNWSVCLFIYGIWYRKPWFKNCKNNAQSCSLQQRFTEKPCAVQVGTLHPLTAGISVNTFF